jgi:serine/threonine protein kinase
MAPEVMFKQNHGIAADYFAVGVIAFECIVGRRPYLGKSRVEIRKNIIDRQARFRKEDLEKYNIP